MPEDARDCIEEAAELTGGAAEDVKPKTLDTKLMNGLPAELLGDGTADWMEETSGAIEELCAAIELAAD